MVQGQNRARRSRSHPQRRAGRLRQHIQGRKGCNRKRCPPCQAQSNPFGPISSSRHASMLGFAARLEIQYFAVLCRSNGEAERHIDRRHLKPTVSPAPAFGTYRGCNCKERQDSSAFIQNASKMDPKTPFLSFQVTHLPTAVLEMVKKRVFGSVFIRSRLDLDIFHS